jgi:serine O-acetyltransferase
VVVKDVPEGATVVGIPGRVVARRSEVDEKHAKRKAFAEKIGFDAYGTTQDMPDPVANAINCMLDHIHAMDGQMQNMCKSLKALGSELDEVRLPDLGACDIGSASEPEKLDTPSQKEKIKENQEDK